MITNIGSADKIFRFVVGFGAIGAGVYFQSWWGALGLIPITTATLGWCPPYAIFGMSTCSMKKTAEEE